MFDEFLLADYLYALDVLAVFTALAILGSSLDDLFIDLYYWGRELYRWVFVRSRYQPLRIEDLYQDEQRPFAIMVPAWKEYDVIAKMVENTLATVEYKKFVIFIGTYQNDAETTAEADRMARRYPQMVQRATVLNDGPTCKADCLNWIVQSIALYEERNQMRFAGVIMHDCEDVIHPLELHLFNYLIDRKDLIQLPVLSLEREWHEFVAGTYLDDFSEWHCKEMVVRESMTGIVPGSGVATCYGRRAIEELARQNNNMPFNTDTLTEDYEMSHRLKKIGTSQVFVRFPVQYKAKRRNLFTREEKLVDTESLIATREYFPSGFRAAYRQRARWILGVAFQGWQQMGWRGGLVANYLYLRDRKGIFTSFVGLLAYFIVFNLIILWALRASGYDFVRYPSFVQPEGLMFQIFVINFWLFMNRIVQRVYFVYKLNGLEQAFLSIPRMAVSNVINFFAVCRAWKIFLIHFVTGKRIAWDKTQHVYPSMDELKRQRGRIGDLLLGWQVINQEHLEQALNMQQQNGKKIGAILLESGVVSEEMLADALAEQSGLPRAHLKPQAVSDFAGRLPRHLVMQHRIVPFALGEGGELNLALADPLSEGAQAEIAAQVTDKVAYFVVSEREVVEAIEWYNTGEAHHASQAGNKRRLLGDILLGMGAISLDALSQSLAGYEVRRDGLIGAYLVARGVISQRQLEEALRRQEGGREARQNPADMKWSMA
ncbi:MAG TPA: glycosyl transferase family protein [Sideroxyarcus sp.]|nr:glycosyl transferase family protein [Sideroxyarcus sp.]